MTEAAVDRRRPIQLLAAVAVAVPAALSVFSHFQQRAFDSYVHMFLADHYARGWFNLWEPRWYGGFSVTTYPPMAHQLVALFSKVIGMEPAYVLVTLSAVVAMALVSGRLAETFGGPDAAPWGILLAALIPTAARFGYVYGQLAMIVAAPFALWAIVRLHRYLSSGRVLDLLAFAFSTGACAGTHHVSTLFVAGGCVLVGIQHLVEAWPKGKGALGQVVVRGAIGAVFAGASIYLVIYPFWRYAAVEPQVEIPHFSRDPLWERSLSLDVVEQVAMSAISILLIAWAAVRKKPALVFVGLGALVLLVVSLGDTTPLPRLIFRAQYRWLTYDKFHYWGTLLVGPLVACFLATLRRPLAWVAAAALVTIPASIVSVSHKMSDELQPEFVEDIRPFTDVLNAPGAEHYRHLFLGFGDQFCRFDTAVRSPNADGDYHTARTHPALRNSGIGTLDTSKHYERGLQTLQTILSQADELHLRWVFTQDLWYETPVLEAGFELKEVWPSGVTLFEKEVPPLPPRPPEVITPINYLWGLSPLTCLVGCVLFSWLSERTRRVRAATAATR